MTLSLPRVGALFVSVLLVSCGGGGGGSAGPAGGPGSGGGTPTPTVTLPTAGMRVEESDAAVTLSGAWTKSDSGSGWSGGSAMQASSTGAMASITFIGTSVRWIGSRGRGMGIATVSVDGTQVREVDL